MIALLGGLLATVVADLALRARWMGRGTPRRWPIADAAPSESLFVRFTESVSYNGSRVHVRGADLFTFNNDDVDYLFPDQVLEVEPPKWCSALSLQEPQVLQVMYLGTTFGIPWRSSTDEEIEAPMPNAHPAEIRWDFPDVMYVEARAPYASFRVTRVLTLGVIADVLAWGSAIAATFQVLGFARRRRRRAKGLCESCGYNLAGTTRECPECGHVPRVQAVPTQ
ncbi:MAG: hypothetical protein GC200_08270 [Tepidisphaera sp.]|nr:hypothetical protein [Tepidisphaera sp.]